jgi:hypothetical protein
MRSIGINLAQPLCREGTTPADRLASPINADLRAYLRELLVMATIVTTMLYAPAAGLLALACFLIGISPGSLASFGGALHPVVGLFAWWAIFWIPTAVYTGFIVPWGGRDLRPAARPGTRGGSSARK